MIRKLKLARSIVAAGLLSVFCIVGVTNVNAQRTVGLNLGADAPDGSNGGTMEATDEAGLTGFAQKNWNNLTR
jgi:hypothetical protein